MTMVDSDCLTCSSRHTCTDYRERLRKIEKQNHATQKTVAALNNLEAAGLKAVMGSDHWVKIAVEEPTRVRITISLNPISMLYGVVVAGTNIPFPDIGGPLIKVYVAKLMGWGSYYEAFRVLYSWARGWDWG